MRDPGRTLLVAVVVAAVVAFAAGWIARGLSEDTPSERMDRAGEDLSRKLRGLGQ